MKFIDVSETLKSGLAQAMGAEYMEKLGDISALNSGQLADVGRELFAQEDVASGVPVHADIALHALMDICGRMVIDNKKYVGQVKSIYIDSREWGGYLVRYYMSTLNIMRDEVFNPDGYIDYFSEGGVDEAKRIAAIEYGYYKPAVNGKIFAEATSHMIPLTIAKEQFFTAFDSWDKMNEFLSGIYTSVQNTIEALAQVKSKMLLSSAIVAARLDGNEVKLLTEFNTQYGENLTAENALTNKDFIAYAYSRIDEVKGNMSDMTTAYSGENNLSFTNNEDFRLILHKRLPNRARYLLRSSTFNEGLLSIGEYDEVNSWQGIESDSKPDFNFDTTSKVIVSQSTVEKLGGSAEGDYTVSGVLGIAFDYRALGIVLSKESVSEKFASSRKTWNYFHHFLTQTILDRKHKMVIFTLT